MSLAKVRIPSWKQNKSQILNYAGKQYSAEFSLKSSYEGSQKNPQK